MTVSIPKLFQPIRVGAANLQHRVVMAPMSRFCADKQHVPGALAVEYYKQRTRVPGTLSITESTTSLRAQADTAEVLASGMRSKSRGGNRFVSSLPYFLD